MKGNADLMSAILRNPTVDVDVLDEETGTNAFWMAAYYGHVNIMQILSRTKISKLITHKETKSNVLHLAVERNHPVMARILL